MSEAAIDQLLALVARKASIDATATWSEGSATYIRELKTEISEVEEEIGVDRLVFLEDELGDVLWDYLNLLSCLADEESVSIESVFVRAVAKYSERIESIENGGSWKDVKAAQKARLSDEHQRNKTAV